MNSVLLEGTLTRDPELSQDANGRPQCLLLITSDRYLRRENSMEKQTTGIHVYTKGKMAEQCMRLFRAGRKIRVVGCLQALSGKNAEGRDMSRLVIDAEHLEVKSEITKKQEREPSIDFFFR
ncbi:MAG: single-stranded DNA-binding protein [Treponema sp.]|nr:single-stranded DNA-binding protein [Treponema sp.]